MSKIIRRIRVFATDVVEIEWTYPDGARLEERRTAPPAATKTARISFEAASCTPASPCCERRDEYNGYQSGPTIFTCPKRCGCHD